MNNVSTKRFIPYARQSITPEDSQAASETLLGDWITRGPKVEAFEAVIAEYCEVNYAVAFNSGSSALAAAYFAAELSPHDRVITTPNSFIATIGAAFQIGAKPVFVDIDRTTGSLNLDLVQHNINYPSTRGRTFITPVHFSGIPVDMCALDRMIQDPDTIIIEDAAHALGSTYNEGQRVGSCAFSQMTIFSFHPIKTITTCEGGMVTTNDEDFYKRLQKFRNNGIVRDTNRWFYEVQSITGNYNFTEFQAALGLSQLKRIDAFIEKRRILIKAYRERLQDLPHMILMTAEFDAQTAYHLFVVQIDFKALGKERTQVMEQLLERGIGTQVHYIPIYKHPFFTATEGDISEYFPEMETYYAQALSLPLYYDLEVDDIDFIIENLKAVLD